MIVEDKAGMKGNKLLGRKSNGWRLEDGRGSVLSVAQGMVEALCIGVYKTCYLAEGDGHAAKGVCRSTTLRTHLRVCTCLRTSHAPHLTAHSFTHTYTPHTSHLTSLTHTSHLTHTPHTSHLPTPLAPASDRKPCCSCTLPLCVQPCLPEGNALHPVRAILCTPCV